MKRERITNKQIKAVLARNNIQELENIAFALTMQGRDNMADVLRRKAMKLRLAQVMTRRAANAAQPCRSKS